MSDNDSPPHNSGGQDDESIVSELRADGGRFDRALELNDQQRNVLEREPTELTALRYARLHLRHIRRKIISGDYDEVSPHIDSAMLAVDDSFEEMEEVLENGSDLSIDASPDQIIDLLSARRRRITLRIVAEEMTEQDSHDQTDFARLVAAHEQDKAVGMVTHAERKSVYNALTSAHLPALERVDVVEWSERGKVVSRGEAAEDVAGLLGRIEAVCGEYESNEAQ